MLLNTSPPTALGHRLTDSSRTILARAPTRIDFGGGWTDVPPYSDVEGGYVCNAAIDRYAFARVSAGSLSAGAAGNELPAGESALATAALRRTNLRGEGAPIALRLESDYPIGAGLGGSSAAGVASLGALLAWRGEVQGRDAIAELSRSLEVEDLGIAGGRQDHYAAAHGGALGLEFTEGRVVVNRIELHPSVVNELERRSILVYTGQSRISSETITAVLDGYASRSPRICTALHRMRALAREMRAALGRGSIDDLAALVGEHWVHQRSLHPGISTPMIDKIMETAAREGGAGGKAMGASGGGCVLIISRAGEEERLRNAAGRMGAVLPFRLDLSGLTVTEEFAA